MPIKVKTTDKAIIPKKTSEEIRSFLSKCKIGNDPDLILQEVYKEFSDSKSDKLATNVMDNAFKAITLFEFENGALMTTVIQEGYKTFGVDMMRKVQEEYACETIIEKATAELATINYIRTLEVQRRITAYLDMNSLTDNGVKYLAIMSKELDRANRHYLTAVQVLRSLKQVPFQLTVKANTAVIGQNQLVQANSHE